MKISLLSYTAFFLLLLTSCKDKAGETQPESKSGNVSSDEVVIRQSQYDPLKMKWGQLEDHDFYTELKLNGMVDLPPTAIALVSPPMSGFVRQMNLLHSQKVKKGEILLMLENPEYVEMQQSYLEMKGQLGYLKSEFERYSILAGEQVSSKKEMLKSEAEYNVAHSRYMALEKKLKMLNINMDRLDGGEIVTSIAVYSPMNGYITEINASKGQFVTQNEVLVRIGNMDEVHIEVNVLEKDIHRIKTGQEVLYKMAYSEQQFSAKVIHIGKEVNQENMTVMVHCDPRDPSGLLPGMYVNAVMETDKVIEKALPESAVFTVGDISYVLIKKETKGDQIIMKKFPVKLLKRDQNYISVDPAGLLGKEILVEGGFNLVTGE